MIYVTSLDEKLSIAGITSLNSVNGIFEIKELKFIGSPSNSYNLRINCPKIDE